jgi:hypothetical protein
MRELLRVTILLNWTGFTKHPGAARPPIGHIPRQALDFEAIKNFREG